MDGRRNNSSEENGDHPEEESDEGITMGESRIISPAKRGKIAEQKRAFERKVEREVERRMHELGLGELARSAGDPEHQGGTLEALGGFV